MEKHAGLEVWPVLRKRLLLLPFLSALAPSPLWAAVVDHFEITVSSAGNTNTNTNTNTNLSLAVKALDAGGNSVSSARCLRWPW